MGRIEHLSFQDCLKTPINGGAAEIFHGLCGLLFAVSFFESVNKVFHAVHRFDEVICYDLNKYNFSYKSDMIFFSIEQSQNQKQGAAEVPVLTGTMIGTGLLLLSGGVGIIIGAGGTLGAQKFFGRKKRT